MDGTVQHTQEKAVAVVATSPQDVDSIAPQTGLSSVYFVMATLYDAKGATVSDNFYWHSAPLVQNVAQNMQELNNMATANLQLSGTRKNVGGKMLLTVTIKNTSNAIALMAHLQLRRQKSGLRVLPVYYSDNYVSLPPGESKTITIEAAVADLKGETPYLALDGWNVTTTSTVSNGISFGNNAAALISSVPAHEFKMIEVKKP